MFDFTTGVYMTVIAVIAYVLVLSASCAILAGLFFVLKAVYNLFAS